MEDNFVCVGQHSRDYLSRRRRVISEGVEHGESESEVYHKEDWLRLKLLAVLKEVVLFQHLTPEQVEAVIDAMNEERVNPGQLIVNQGEDGDTFYVAESGTYDILRQTATEMEQVDQIVNAGFFGEVALLYRMPSPTTLMASSSGTLWTINRQSFITIVQKSNFHRGKLYEEFLGNVPMLSSISKHERMGLADALIPKSYYNGECIIKEGEEANGIYFVEKGEVTVKITEGGNEKEIGHTLGPGAYFGEMALVENTPRSASVYAIGPVKLVFLERLGFERLLGPCMDVMRRNSSDYVLSKVN